MDDKGRKVIHGKLWSDAHTNIFLVVALHGKDKATCLTPKVGQCDVDIRNALVDSLGQDRWTMSIMTTVGRPRFLHATVGACLELPEDLAEDSLKVRYVTEWLVTTCSEALRDRRLAVSGSSKRQFAVAMADAAQVAIAKAL